MNKIITIAIIGIFCFGMTGNVYCQDDSTRNVLKQGLLGAGTGAIAAGASGGKAGQGALIGAGTGVIGSVLLDAITTPSAPKQSSSGYPRYAPPPQQYQQQQYQQQQYQGQYDDPYYQQEPVEYYEEPPQESSSSKMLKQGLLGAGTGAIASGASGGNAGQGALIGAGTGIIGGALLDAMTEPSQPKRVYRRPAPRPQQYPPSQQAGYQTVTQQNQGQNLQVQDVANPEGGKKRIIKKYDDKGKLVSEEEIYY